MRVWGWFKGSHWLIKAAVALIVLYAAINGFSFRASKTSQEGRLPEPGERTRVEYIVSGTAKEASITFTNEKGWTEQKRVAIPWRWSSKGDVQKDTPLYISAQSEVYQGSIKVQIVVNGKVWKEASEFGPFVVATVRGYAGDK